LTAWLTTRNASTPRHARESLEDQSITQIGSDLRVIVRRSHLDDVDTSDRYAHGYTTHRVEQLTTRQSARFGCTGARRRTRIHHVDVDRQEDRVAAGGGDGHRLGQAGTETPARDLAHLVTPHPLRRHPRQSLGVGPVPPQPELEEPVPPYRAGVDQPPHRRAVAVERPELGVGGVGVGVEVDHRDASPPDVAGHSGHVGQSDGVVAVPDVVTSYAVPVILPSGQYILHVSGANASLNADHVVRSQPLWNNAQMLLVQGEVAEEATLAAMELMHQRAGLVILDPAPVTHVTDAMLAQADVLTPNAVEFTQLVGQSTDPENGCPILFQRWPRLRTIIVTLGSLGVFWQDRDGHGTILPACSVAEVDPTAAGDAFNGALAYGLSHQQSWEDAIHLGLRAGAVAASRAGALPSLGRWPELQSV